MRHRSPQAATRQGAATRVGILLAALPLAGCGPGMETVEAVTAVRGVHLVERSGYQALYDAKGRILRLLQDANHDGVADAQVLYWPNGKPKAGEIDTDLDGRIDRWETFDTDGKLTRVGTATNGGSTTNSGATTNGGSTTR